MAKLTFVAVFFGLFTISGCEFVTLTGDVDVQVTKASEQSDEDNATDAIHEMYDLAAQGDWDSYVERFYGEQHKFESEADREALVLRFENKWGDQVVENLQRAIDFEPRIDGDQAYFEDGDEVFFVLHRDLDGTWKFHL